MTPNQTTTLYKEQVTHGTHDFPVGFYEVLPTESWNGIKHHWHEEIEMLYFAQGSGTMEINMEAFPVLPGTFFFVNSGGLHSMTPLDTCVESAILFHPRILSFDTYDRAQSRLLQPLQKGGLAFPRSLSSSHPAFVSIKKEYEALVDICHTWGDASSANASAQLFIKAGLLKILAILSLHNLLGASVPDNGREKTIKTVLSFIRAHYSDKLYVRDLAKLSNMNEQYFCRFFKEAIGQSPIAYVNEYRIRQAMLLLRDTDQSVMDISLQCGFSNFGNFLKEFKKHTQTTPLKYRNATHTF